MDHRQQGRIQTMKQGDLYFAKLDPAAWSEQKGLRPVVIISGDSMNEALDICIICPLTSSIKNFPGCPVLEKNKVNGLEKDSEVLTFQIRVLSKSRLLNKIGVISQKELTEIKKGLVDILTY